MSGSKRLLEEREADLAHGIHLCIERGALKECENCSGTYYDAGAGIEEALEDTDDAEERELMQAAFDEHGGLDYCARCDHRDRS